MTLQDALIFADDEMEADWAHRVLAKEITRLRIELASMTAEMNRALAYSEMAGHDADAMEAERDALAKRWEALREWSSDGRHAVILSQMRDLEIQYDHR